MRNRLAQLRFPDAVFFKGDLQLLKDERVVAKSVVQLKRRYRKGTEYIWLVPWHAFFTTPENFNTIKISWLDGCSSNLYSRMRGAPGKWPEKIAEKVITYGLSFPRLCLRKGDKQVLFDKYRRPAGFRALRVQRMTSLPPNYIYMVGEPEFVGKISRIPS